MLQRPLNVLQLSYRPREPKVPQALKVLVAALIAWGIVAALAWLVRLAV